MTQNEENDLQKPAKALMLIEALKMGYFLIRKIITIFRKKG